MDLVGAAFESSLMAAGASIFLSVFGWVWID